MPISLDASRSFTDYRSSRILNQDLKDKIGDQPIGVALWNNDYKELGAQDNLLLSTIGLESSTYSRSHGYGHHHMHRGHHYNRHPRDSIVVAPVILMPASSPNPANSGSSMVYTPWGDEATESDAEKLREAQVIVARLTPVTPSASSASATPARGAGAAYRRYDY